jgi:3-oxoadipate enol-lactonase
MELRHYYESPEKVVICGALDQATPPMLNRVIAQNIPGAAFREIPACGHCPPLEKPQEFLRAFES